MNMKPVYIAGVILAIFFSVLTIVFATPANAAGGCVTRKEFRQVHQDDSIGYVRAMFGTRGRTTSTNYFSDGDVWKTVEFRQCGKTWRRSAIMLSFSKRAHDEYVSDWECYDGDCYDFGYYETVYSGPLSLDSKFAVWR
jgi:hypothetical protein